jgi:YfiH family protein
MRRDQRDGLLAYRFETLPGGLDAFVSTRHGGVSPPPYDSLNLGLWVGDERDNVVENRRRLLQGFGTSLERSVWCKQVHADRVVVVDDGDAGRGSTDEETIVAEADALVTVTPGVDDGDAGRGSTDEETIVAEADALVTVTPGLTLCVTVADCVPVVIFDPVRRVAGLAHAGWRGTVARICSQTVRVMRERFGCDPASMLAAIGPSIGPVGYEVGAEVIDPAQAAFGERAAEVLGPGDGDRALFDLWSANRIDLEAAGVAPGRIEIGAVASEAQLEDFYSHRAEGPRTGRFIAAVSLQR